MRWLFTILLLWSSSALAHQTGESRFVAHIKVDEQVVDVLVSFPGRDATQHILMDDDDEVITHEQMIAAYNDVTAYIDARLGVYNNNEPCEVIERSSSPANKSLEHMWFLKSFRCAKPLQQISLHNTVLLDTRGGYTHLGRIQIGDQIETTVFNRQFTVFEFDVELGETSVLDTIARYVWEGILHIVLGPDHVLFVMLLILLTINIRQLLIIVTSFTVAHSLTLVLAVLDIVDIPPHVIEPLIALSIGYMAIEALLHRKSRFLVAVTFGFGLFHGFGFSYVLRDNVGLPTDSLVLALASFNLGVEFGQVLIVLCLVPLQRWVMTKPWGPRSVRIVATLSLLLAVGWFVQRVFF